MVFLNLDRTDTNSMLLDYHKFPRKTTKKVARLLIFLDGHWMLLVG